tara:strand:- start:134 stop:691 length:558 start_codon:yes stop_codon:yes gene_type:complete
MTVLNLKFFPDPILRKKASKVEVINDEIRLLLNDMAETMYQSNGVGLSANQVGQLKRAIVMDCSKEDNEDKLPDKKFVPQLYKMINPEIISFSEKISEWEEGCLSIPRYRSLVKRPAEITIKFLDEYGKENILDATGLLATCIQHEIDHLNGKLFIDHLSRIKKNMIIKKIQKKIKEEKEDNNEI